MFSSKYIALTHVDFYGRKANCRVKKRFIICANLAYWSTSSFIVCQNLTELLRLLCFYHCIIKHPTFVHHENLVSLN